MSGAKLTILQIWHLIQGILFFVIMLFLMFYPQILDLLNFSGNQFTESDYDSVRTAFSAVFIIGGYYILHGLSPYYVQRIAPIIMKQNPYDHESNELRDPSLLFAMFTITNRIIIVPIILMILNIIVWNNPSGYIIRVTSIIFLIYDPAQALITLFIVRKYGSSEGKQRTQQGYNMTMNMEEIGDGSDDNIHPDNPAEIEYLNE